MKCLSLHQPYASLIRIGAKPDETRGWGTAYRGPLGIHASKRWTKQEIATCRDDVFWDVLKHHYRADLGDLGLGVIVCLAWLDDCVPNPEPPVGRAAKFGFYGEGRFAWRLDHVFPVGNPLPLKGRQGLFEFDCPDYLRREYWEWVKPRLNERQQGHLKALRTAA